MSIYPTPGKWCRRNLLGAILPLSVVAATSSPADAQQAPTEAAPASQPAADVPAPAAAPEEHHESWFHRHFIDDEDGKIDLSNFLAKGGFVPMPIIITEPAVDGGFGIAAIFISVDEDDPRNITRTVGGAFKTGNGSYGFGLFQSGHAFDGRLSYKGGIGRGKITLSAYPQFAPQGVEYTNSYDYGIIGSALWHLKDRRFSLGPSIDFRKLKSTLDIPGLPPEFADDFGNTLHTGALGFGFHFDSRDNPMTPTRGLNAFVDGKFNDGAFGSDRDFQIYDADVYAFHKMTSHWRLGFKAEVDAARGDFPSFFAPSIDLRGVQAVEFQGSTVLSTEMEITHQLNDRWSLLAFGGLGLTDAGSKRIFENSGAIFAGGGGIRYRLARKLGLDFGADVAVGPGGPVFYLQFGHAWSMGMD